MLQWLITNCNLEYQTQVSNKSVRFLPTVYDYLGCWKYVTSNDSKFLPKIILSPAKNHVSAVHDCALAARSRGIPVFGIRNSSECLGSVHAALTYMRYGPSNECYNGTGGPTAMDVYSLEGKYNTEFDLDARYKQQQFL